MALKWEQISPQTLSEILNTSVEVARKAIQDCGVEMTKDRALTREEIQKLRPVLFRYRAAPPTGHGQKTRDSEREGVSPPSAASPHEGAESPVTPPSAVSPREDAESPVTPSAVSPQKSAEPRAHKKRPNMENPAPPLSPMDSLVLENKIMIDTCSLMHDQCPKIIAELLPALIRNQRKLIVPRKVILELKKLERTGKDRKTSESAHIGRVLCQKLYDRNCLSVRGSEVDNFADNVFFVHFSNYRLRYPMLLITQDYGLTHDILQLNQMGAEDGHCVRVMRITEDGTLTESGAS